MEDKNLEGFLKQGKPRDVLCWNEQIKYFMWMLVLILPQFAVAYVSQDLVLVSMIPCICLVLEIIMLVSCKKRENKPYGHNYCIGMHSAIISIVLFVDAMMSLYYFVDSKHYGYWVIGIAVFYCICVFGRYFWISMKITRGWYKGCELKMNRSSSTVAIVSGVGTILIAKSLAPYVIGKDATKILFVGLMIICFSIIKYVDYFMMYYRFTKLSEEEQQYIICSGKKAQKVEKKSVYEVIGKKAKS